MIFTRRRQDGIGKIVYLLEKEEQFLRDLPQYFIRGNILAVNALRTSKLDILYAKLGVDFNTFSISSPFF